MDSNPWVFCFVAVTTRFTTRVLLVDTILPTSCDNLDVAKLRRTNTFESNGEHTSLAREQTICVYHL